MSLCRLVAIAVSSLRFILITSKSHLKIRLFWIVQQYQWQSRHLCLQTEPLYKWAHTVRQESFLSRERHTSFLQVYGPWEAPDICWAVAFKRIRLSWLRARGCCHGFYVVCAWVPMERFRVWAGKLTRIDSDWFDTLAKRYTSRKSSKEIDSDFHRPGTPSANVRKCIIFNEWCALRLKSISHRNDLSLSLNAAALISCSYIVVSISLH